MRLLLDTHVMLWAVFDPDRLSSSVLEEISDPENILMFSVVGLWEVAIKRGRNHPDFAIEPDVLRAALLDADYVELPVTGEHAICVRSLPPIHRDPFDRLLIAQTLIEGATLMTADEKIERYDIPVRRITRQ